MGKIILEEQSEAETPATNKVVIYPKAGGNVYKKADDGTEEKLVIESSVYTQAEVDTISGTLSAEIDSDIDAAFSAGWSGDIPTISGTMTVVDGLITNYS